MASNWKQIVVPEVSSVDFYTIQHHSNESFPFLSWLLSKSRILHDEKWKLNKNVIEFEKARVERSSREASVSRDSSEEKFLFANNILMKSIH